MFTENGHRLGSFERTPGKTHSLKCNSCISEEWWSKSGSCRDFKQPSQEGLAFRDLGLVSRYQPPCSTKVPVVSVGIFSTGFVKGFRIFPIYLDHKAILPLQANPVNVTVLEVL